MLTRIALIGSNVASGVAAAAPSELPDECRKVIAMELLLLTGATATAVDRCWRPGIPFKLRRQARSALSAAVELAAAASSPDALLPAMSLVCLLRTHFCLSGGACDGWRDAFGGSSCEPDGAGRDDDGAALARCLYDLVPSTAPRANIGESGLHQQFGILFRWVVSQIVSRAESDGVVAILGQLRFVASAMSSTPGLASSVARRDGAEIIASLAGLLPAALMAESTTDHCVALVLLNSTLTAIVTAAAALYATNGPSDVSAQIANSFTRTPSRDLLHAASGWKDDDSSQILLVSSTFLAIIH